MDGGRWGVVLYSEYQEILRTIEWLICTQRNEMALSLIRYELCMKIVSRNHKD